MRALVFLVEVLLVSGAFVVIGTQILAPIIVGEPWFPILRRNRHKILSETRETIASEWDEFYARRLAERQQELNKSRQERKNDTG